MQDSDDLQMIIPSRQKDLGSFQVRRVLPYAKHRMVGPFIFLDHMGPAEFDPGSGITVRPHPHINLATVTYLFEGIFRHQDSLGSDQLIEPGAINWMTAGRGVVHSERTPESIMNQKKRVHGIQLWVALPEKYEEITPTFFHHPKETLPEFKIGEVQLKLLLGKLYDYASPVSTYSEMFYLETYLPKGTYLKVPAKNLEAAAYVVSGKIKIGALHIQALEMAVRDESHEFGIEALEDSRVMLLGGVPLGERHIYWNFVSSSKERIEKAKECWKDGPTKDNARFHPIPTDHDEYIPLPND